MKSKTIFVNSSTYFDLEQVDVFVHVADALNKIIVHRMTEGNGICHFSYLASANKIVEVFGTIHPDWFSNRDLSNGGEESSLKENDHFFQVYFNISENKWKYYRISNLVAVF